MRVYKKPLVIIIILAGISLIGCNSRIEKSLQTKVENATEKFNITDAEIIVEYKGDYDGRYKLFNIFVESEEFENLNNEDKYKFIVSFSSGDLSTMTINTGIVTSNNNTYKVDSFPDWVLTKDDQIVYTHRTREEKEKTSEESETITYEKEPSEDNKGFAWAVAEKEVKEILKAPSTAKFPFSYLNEDIKEVGVNTFVVKSYVDAENSFGANIRSNFMVKIKKTGENTYNLLDIKIYE